MSEVKLGARKQRPAEIEPELTTMRLFLGGGTAEYLKNPFSMIKSMFTFGCPSFLHSNDEWTNILMMVIELLCDTSWTSWLDQAFVFGAFFPLLAKCKYIG